MAGKSFSFNKIERSFFTVELKDGKKVLVKMPQKKTFEKMTAFQSQSEDTPFDEQVDMMFGLCADIMSNNKTGKAVTADYLSKNYDFEELTVFIDEYVDFVNGAQNDPN